MLLQAMVFLKREGTGTCGDLETQALMRQKGTPHSNS